MRAVHFKILFFIDERLILKKLGKSESLFWRQNLNLLANTCEEREVLSSSVWPREILMDFPGNTENLVKI